MGTTGDEVIGYKSIVIEDNRFPRGKGGMCGKLESVSVEVMSPVMSLSPVMSTSTPADEGETTEEPVVVVSCCGGG